MPGFGEAPTAPDLMTWLTEQDLSDWAEPESTGPERVRFTTRTSRTARQHFEHLYGSGMTAAKAYEMTLRWIGNGCDAERYEVTELPDGDRIDTRKPRSRFEGLYHGPPRREHLSCGKTITEVERPKMSKAEQRARDFRREFR